MFDLLLFDVKHYDSDKHYEGTHVHNELIIENLAWAISQGIEVLPRIPVIPDFNDSLDDAKGIATLLNQLERRRFNCFLSINSEKQVSFTRKDLFL